MDARRALDTGAEMEKSETAAAMRGLVEAAAAAALDSLVPPTPVSVQICIDRCTGLPSAGFRAREAA